MSDPLPPSIPWPSEQPTLETDRLLLRPLVSDDAKQVQSLASDFDVADTTLNVPHPYLEGMAESWIGGHPENFHKKVAMTFGITRKEDELLIGVVGLGFTIRFFRAELGYWIGRPFWNRGYATEASTAVVAFGLQELGLHKIESTHLTRNPASGRVLEKIGFKQEGVLKAHVMKWNCFEDVAVYGLLSPVSG